MSTRKEVLPDTGGKLYGRVKRDYKSQSLGRKGGRIDVVCHQYGFTSRAEEVPTITEHNDARVSKRVLRLVIEFADILLRAAKQQSGPIPSQPLNLLHIYSLKLTFQAIFQKLYRLRRFHH